MYDVAIVGAGIIGTFIARELSRYDLKIVLIEKDNDVANGTTKANSAIVHAGYDAEPGTLKAKLNVLGNALFDKVCDELDVPFKRIGSLVIASNEEDMKHVEELYEKGLKNNVPHMKILNKEEVSELEPNLNNDVIGALYSKTCGIVGPFELAIALAENAVENGVELLLSSKVCDIRKENRRYFININNGEKVIESKYVINCAGVYADEINNMVSSSEISITPRRGEYYILDKTAGNFVNLVIFQCPSKKGKGVLVTPTVHGNLLIGPNVEDIEDKELNDTTFKGLQSVKNKALKTTDKIPFNKVITSFAGLRAVASTGDFIIEESREAKNFINVAGIQSPGLASSPAIANYAIEILKELNGGLKKKQEFNPLRRKIVRFHDLNEEERNELIRKDSSFGRIICRCEQITEGEIIDAIHRKVGATTVDGVKRRARPGMGRCQGGFCGPRVLEILARELGIREDEVLKSNEGSYMLCGETKEKGILKETIEQAASAVESES